MDALPLCAWLARRALAISAGSLKNWAAILSYKRVKNHPLYRPQIPAYGQLRFLLNCYHWCVSLPYRINNTSSDQGWRGWPSGIVKIRDDFAERTWTYSQRIPEGQPRRPSHQYSNSRTCYIKRFTPVWPNLLIYPISFSLCFIGTQPLPVPAGLPPLPSTSTLSSSRKTSRFS